MTSPLGVAVGLLSILGGLFTNFLNVCPFDCTAVAGSGKVGPVNQVNHTSWVVKVTPTNRPKSVRNRSVIELFLWRCLCCHFALLTFLLV